MSLKTLKRRIRSEFWIPLRMLPYALLPDPLNLLVTLPAFLCPTALRRGGRHCWLRRRAGLWATEAVEMSLESLERRIPSEIWVPLRMIPYALQPGELNLLVTLLAFLCPAALLGLACCFCRRGGRRCRLFRRAGLRATIKAEAVEKSLKR